MKWLLILLLLLPLAAADTFYTASEVSQMRYEAHHILLDGSFYELRDFREETSVNWYPEIENIFDFARAQQDLDDSFNDRRDSIRPYVNPYHLSYRYYQPRTVCHQYSCVTFYR